MPTNHGKIDYEDAEDYEQSFMENYLKMVAEKKIESLKAMLAGSSAEAARRKYSEEIENIRRNLKVDLENLKDEQFSENVGGKECLKCSPENTIEDCVYQGFAISGKLYSYLFDSQKVGLKWMLDLHIRNQGGVLADEMGLGKTVQFIAFISTLCKNGRASRILILSPATVVYQWNEELTLLTDLRVSGVIDPKPGVFVLGYDNYKVICKDYLNSSSSQAHYKIPKANALGKKLGYLDYRMEFDLVALDEGHRIKNDYTQISKLVKSIQSPIKYVISGTPIQNNLTELWSIFNFINPRILGSEKDFTDEFVENIRGNSERSYRYSVLLRSIVEPFILRRLKCDYKHSLPKKIDKVIFTTLTDVQNNLYIKEIEKIQAGALNRRNDSHLKAIDILRKICNHPYLVMGKSYLDITECSCKMKILMELLVQWERNGDKVLVFTQTVQMQKIIVEAINTFNTQCLETQDKLVFSTMSGATNIAKRQGIISLFNTDPSIFCFLLTTKVGGLGLNLTGANRIVIYDPDWNPSVDNQAKERIYRHGQRSDVEIYRVICRNTVEEKIYQKQIYKDCLSKKILKNPSTQIQKDLMSLFSYGIPLKKEAAIEIDPICYDRENSEEIVSSRALDLADVAEDDREAFEKAKEMHFKDFLTGSELILLIKERENALGDGLDC